MDYVIFDLEWNQCPFGKEKENKRMPFEIIEIGAVKLDKERNRIGNFRQIVRPKVYRKLSAQTKKIVRLSDSDLKKGIPFQEAVHRFLTWAGPDSVFCTWGSTDLTELQRNMKFYNMLHMLPGPFPYFDVQKLFAIEYERKEIRRSLEYAVDLLGIEKKEAFHSALCDAGYTAEILKTIRQEYFRNYESIDTYQNPKCKTDEIHTAYDTHTVFVSREFRGKEELLQDPEVRSTPCCSCSKKTRKKIRWFSVNAKRYLCISKCRTHGLIRGEIQICHNDEGKFFAKKTLVLCEEEDFLSVKGKQKQMQEKRRKKREQLSAIT